MQDQRVAFVGLDGLALAMARRLLEASFQVHVHDPHHRLAALVREGARPALLPADAAEDARVVVLAASGAEAWEYLFDDGGLTETMPEGGCLVDMSRMPEADSHQVSRRLSGYGLPRLELVPVGSERDAAHGDLLLLLAGAPDDIAATASVLEVLGTTWHVGPTASIPTVARAGGVQYEAALRQRARTPG